MAKPIAFFDEPTDFSLVQGGPVFQLLLRAGLLKPPTDLLIRRIVVITAIAWLPLLIISAVSGQLFRGPDVPFLKDVGAHTRFLLCVPILICAEVIVHRRIKVIVRQFLDRNIVAPEDRPRFEELIASAMRLRNSIVAELLMLALAILGGSSLARRYVALTTVTWYASPAGDQTHLTPAGYWYLYVSLTIFRFIWLRWFFRLCIWYRFLWQVSRRVPLRLNALHPDGAGGLGFLSGSLFAFAPILVAITIGLSGIFGNEIWHEGRRLPQFQIEIASWILGLMLLVLTPLMFFALRMAEAKRQGLREYGLVASRYVSEFHRKWLEGNAPEEPLLGSADIQSLADLSNSFGVAQDMRTVPFSRAAVIRLALITALPFAPLILTMIPLNQLLDRVFQSLL